MKIRTRLAWLLCLLTLIFIGALISQHIYDQNRLIALFRSVQAERESVLDKILELKRTPMQTFVSDFSFWDELVNFVKAPNEKWGVDNLATSLDTFKTNAVWVYNLEGRLVYSFNNLDEAGIKEIPIPREAISVLFTDSHFCHFFVNTSLGLMEFNGATIQHSFDKDRTEPAEGYLFCSRLWDKGYIDNLSELTNSKIAVDDITESRNIKAGKNTVSFTREFTGWDNKPVKYLVVSIVSQALKDAKKSAAQVSLFSIIFSIITLSTLYFFIVFWINIPLTSISQALKIGNSTPLKAIEKQQSEFGEISRMMDNFFAQREKISREIAERKRAEDALAYKTMVLEANLQTSIDGILVVDSANRIVILNKRFNELWQVPQYIRGESDDTKMLQYVSSQLHDPVEFKRKVDYLYEHKDETSRDELELADGRYFDRYSAPLLGTDGAYYGRIWYFRDITERKKAEEELNQALKGEIKSREIVTSMLEDNNRIREELEGKLRELRQAQSMLVQSEKLASLGKLVSDMAHEVNNPLMIISGNAQLSLLDESLSEELKGNLKIIHEECNRAKSIIQRLLMFSRPSKGEQKPLDMNQSISSVVKLLEHQFSLSNVKINTQFKAGLPLVPADEKQLQEVFMNILNNARDAMPGGGEINIKTYLEGEYLKIEIKDSGVGMDDKTLTRLFEPFFTTKEKGTGLGLSVCYGIIKVHNGKIEFKSQMQKGTTAHIWLPIKGVG